MMEVAFEPLAQGGGEFATSSQDTLLQFRSAGRIELQIGQLALQQRVHPIVGLLELVAGECMRDTNAEPLKVGDCGLPVGFIEADAGPEPDSIFFFEFGVRRHIGTVRRKW